VGNHAAGRGKERKGAPTIRNGGELQIKERPTRGRGTRQENTKTKGKESPAELTPGGTFLI